MTLLNSPHLRAGAVMIAVLLSTALVSPLYPLYQREWGLSPGDITRIYVIYMCGSMLTLLFLGRLSDRLGWRVVLLAALALGMAGSLWSALAPDPAQFTAARFVIGVSGSLATGAGSVAMLRLTPESQRGTIALLSSLFLAAGFGAGPLLGGFAGQWLPLPLVSAHLIALAAMAGAALLVLFAMPADTAPRAALKAVDLLPKLAWVAKPHGLRLALACALPFLVFGAFGLAASMAPLMIRDLLGLGGPMVTGLYIATFLTVSSLVMLRARHRSRSWLATFGLVALGLGAVAMMINVQITSALLFAIGTIGCAAGHGTLVLAGTGEVVALSSAQNRGALTATYWTVGYSGSVFPLLIAGQAADIWGTAPAVTGFYAAMAALCALVLVLTRSLLRD